MVNPGKSNEEVSMNKLLHKVATDDESYPGTYETKLTSEEVPVDQISGESASMIRKEESKNIYDTRDDWGNQKDFLLSLVGYIVGTGNLWRFPYLCYDNGGATFLLCYSIALLTVAIPMAFLEISLGQYFKEGAITVWKISPIFKGIGIGVTLISYYWSVYVMSLFSWSLLFLIFSFLPELPWGNCENWWNTETCITYKDILNCFQEDNQTLCEVSNATSLPLMNLTDSVREFWDNRLLQKSSGIDDTFDIQWELLGTLLAAYILVYFCLFKGPKWTGKVVYFTATLPYLLIFVFLVRCIMLPGAVIGIRYYIFPDIYRLIDINVWFNAYSQVLYSFAIGFGILTPLGSHNRFHDNCYRNSILAVLLGALWSVVAGFAVFCVIGFMAHELKKPVEDVATSGIGLAFLVYPTAVLQMPYSQLWSVLFFMMLIMVLLDTVFVTYGAIITSISDFCPKYAIKNSYVSSLIFCIIGFILGIPFVTKSGIYIFELFDYHSTSGIPIMTFTLAECLVVGYVYGINRFWKNLELMLKFKPSRWWMFCIKYFTPGVTSTLLMAQMIEWKPLSYMNYQYPMWAHVLGWSLTLSSLLCIPGYAVWLLVITPSEGRTFKQKLMKLTEYEVEDEQT